MTEKTISSKVWVLAGNVGKNVILEAAMRDVKGQIPPAAKIRQHISHVADVEEVDGERGRWYTVDNVYTPRGKRDEPVDLDVYLEALETPVFDPRDLDELA